MGVAMGVTMGVTKWEPLDATKHKLTRILAAGAAFINVDKLGIHYSPLILPVHFCLVEWRRRSKAGAEL